MGARGLVDTGAILALLDADDAWHLRCSRVFPSLRLPLATSSAVLAELFHLLRARTHELELAWGFIRSDIVTVLPFTDEDMPHLERLMIQYRDRPMDLADATLVRLAQREALSTIFTIDHDDFETYRIGGRSKFRIMPPR